MNPAGGPPRGPAAPAGQAPAGKAPFALVARFDSANYVGARWWHEGLERELDGVARRKALLGILALGVGIAGVGAAVASVSRSSGIDSDALDAQKSFGWNLGAESDPLDYQAAALTEVCPDDVQRTLATRLKPTVAAHLPHYRGTLFHALAATPTTNGLIDTGKVLREQMRPVSNTETRLAFDKGRAFASLFDDGAAAATTPAAPASGTPRDARRADAGAAVLPLAPVPTAAPASAPSAAARAKVAHKVVVVDLPGPLAVAFAAGVASLFDPVFAFDGWPHPRGVVPSHVTLGSALYYASLFEKLADTRAPDAPPVFVLDRARLAPYDDESDRFDNRYLAVLPSAQALRALGAEQVLYVSAQGDAEPDDLNDDFVEYKKAGLELRMVAMSDFTVDPAGTQPAVAVGPRGASGSYEANPNVYYGGSRGSHYWFWHTYGWGTPRVGAVRPMFPPARPPYVPVSRSTPFSRLGSTRSRPTSFGRVTVFKPSSGRSGGYSSSGSWGRGGWGSGS
ncbi:MAG: hypothetical protein IPQ09_11875 [Myxococcales bacterium]|nr:hypothetical protein [Myxococcales bacterium]